MTDNLFIDEVQGHQKRYRKLVSFTHSSTRAALVMLLAAVAAVVIVNTDAYGPFEEILHTELGFFFGEYSAHMSVAHVINDLFMALFFLLVGLEIKYEMTVGELTNIRQAVLPIMGALGGVAMPIVVYLAFNAGNPETVHGWGVPTATDIAFALGILALLDKRVPSGVRVFLSTLAVVDDIIAILVIAVFYGHAPSFGWLMVAAGIMLVLIAMNRMHVYALVPYLIVGVCLWVCVLFSGVHATIAGVLLAFAIPTGSRVNLTSFMDWSGEKVSQAREAYEPEEPVLAQGHYLKTVKSLSRVARQVVPPAIRLEHRLHPWVYFVCMPLFALTNAGVRFVDSNPTVLFADPVLFGVMLGLLVGKPVGIVLMSVLTVKCKIARLPQGVTWMHLVGAGILGGVGFTMAIFVANLAYADALHVAIAKMGILLASLVAGVVGFLFLYVQAKRSRREDEAAEGGTIEAQPEG